ncbi:MAG: ribosome recycling factor [Deltaproteobacteria bacterium]|nr:ribosome recycling factor [Deltaproteobacteria bacterium]
MYNEILKDCNDSMTKRLTMLDKDLGKVRTGRASVSLLDGVKVSYYGNMTALNQVASVSTPDARSIIISPFEKSLIPDISRAIQMADLGIQPVNDGHVVRLSVPPLNEERRKEIVKSIKKLGEETKISVRKIRQDTNTRVRKLEKDKELPEDESKKLQKEIQTKTDSYISQVDQKIEKKEKEILTL